VRESRERERHGVDKSKKMETGVDVTKEK